MGDSYAARPPYLWHSSCQVQGAIVENASFTGIYRVRDFDRFPELHTHAYSGVCYAWKKEDGTHIVLPMGEDNVPHGQCYLLDSSNFALLFQRHAAKISPRGFVPRPPVCSDSPDLLGAWYEESLAMICSGQITCSLHLTDPAACETEGKGACTSISSDEAMFSPAWHPDELCRLPEEKGLPDIPYAAPPSGGEALRPSFGQASF